MTLVGEFRIVKVNCAPKQIFKFKMLLFAFFVQLVHAEDIAQWAAETLMQRCQVFSRIMLKRMLSCCFPFQIKQGNVHTPTVLLRNGITFNALLLFSIVTLSNPWSFKFSFHCLVRILLRDRTLRSNNFGFLCVELWARNAYFSVQFSSRTVQKVIKYSFQFDF